MKKVTVLPHDPNWKHAFEKEAQQIRSALGSSITAIHHIGSTAVPRIYAKPVIDVLVEVIDINDVDQRRPEMESIGYEVMGEFGLPGRRYFRKDDEFGTRTHQIHVFTAGSHQVTRHLAFRDFLITHPHAAKEYSDLKRKLAAEHPHDMDSYMDGKDPFIKAIDAECSAHQDKLETMPNNRQYLFVYGMLRTGGGHSMADHAPGSRFIAAVEINGSLYDMGDYPGLVLGGAGKVIGEIYAVDDETLEQLDDFEATASYSRIAIEVFVEGELYNCWVYTPDPTRCRTAKMIASGDWIAYHPKTEL
jgi:GrpB-like predicted nucleotidyltransferase (UPF0157 family)/gamma-glutamylcyclotransferase (GGCT)/AIG2-like uncharacterized protein YtfP